MSSFNAIATLARRHTGADLADEAHGSELDAYHVVTATDDRQRAQIIITVQATDLNQAIATTRAVLAARFTDIVRLEVMSTLEYDDQFDHPLPALVSVAAAAEILGVTRQAVLARIKRGTLPGRQVGPKLWVLPANRIVRSATK